MKKKELLFVIIGIILFGLGIIRITDSFGYEVIEKKVVKENSASEIDFSSNKDYISFTINKEDIDSGITFEMNVPRVYSEVEGKTLTVLIEQSLDNRQYTEVANKEIGVGNNNLFTLNKLPQNTVYYRVSILADNVRLDLNARNIDCTINVKTDIKYDYEFRYNDKSQEFVAPITGEYTVELWGAAGNYYPSNMINQAGKGAYTKGKITLTKGDKLYVYTGQNAIESENFKASSFNAGSKSAGLSSSATGACSPTNGTNCHNSSSGGGATDIRLVNGDWNDTASLRSRIMVAAGGGGTQYYKGENNDIYVIGEGGAGGGLVGYAAGLYGTFFSTPTPGGTTFSMAAGSIIEEADGKNTTLDGTTTQKHDYTIGATQTKGGLRNLVKDTTVSGLGNNGGFGIGGNGGMYTNDSGIAGAGGGGGGGYYGGAGGGIVYTLTDIRRNCHSPGSGGSSYISGHTGSIAITSATSSTPKSGCTETGTRPDDYVGTTNNNCSIHYSNKVFTETIMIDGEGYSWTNKRGTKMTMPTPPTDSSAYIENGGNAGSGAARIKYVTTTEPGSEVNWVKGSKVKVTARYVDEDGEKLSGDVTNSYNVGDNYTTEEKSFTNYHLKNVDGERSGTVNDDIIVTYIYALDEHTLTVRYIDKDTNKEIIDSIIETKPHGSPYETDKKEFENYSLDSINGEEKGTLIKDTEVIYYYTKVIAPKTSLDTSMIIKILALIFLISGIALIIRFNLKNSLSRD